MKRIALILWLSFSSFFLVAQVPTEMGYAAKYFTPGTWCFYGNYDVGCDCYLDTTCFVVLDTMYLWNNNGLLRVDCLVFADGTTICGFDSIAYADSARASWISDTSGVSGYSDSAAAAVYADTAGILVGYASLWDTTVETIHPLDTTDLVAIGTDDAGGYQFYEQGDWDMWDGYAHYGDGVWSTLPMLGLNLNCANNEQYLSGMLDLSVIGRPHVLFMGWIHDSLTYGYSHRRVAISVDTTDGINIYAANIPSLPNKGIHISTPSLTEGVRVIESDMEFDTTCIKIGRKNFDAGSTMLAYILKLADSGLTYYRHPRVAGESNIFEFDTSGFLTINEAYKFPNADGAANQVLKTDGSGVLSWATISGFDTLACHTLKIDTIDTCSGPVVLDGDLYVNTLHYTGLDPAPGGGSSLWDTTTASANLALHPSDTTWDVSVGTDRMGGTELFRVRDGAVLFDGATGSTPVSGAGTRLMWIPASGTFAAGVVNSTQFDAIGDHSVVFGENNTATGTHNIIAGGGCTATNNYSAIFGDRCVEIYGGYVLLFGSQNEARNYSLCGGYGNSTNSTSSILIGHNLIDYGVGMGNAIFGYGGGSTSGTSILFSGFANINYADYSFTTGQHIINRSYNASVMGRYNIDAGTSNSWVSTDPLFQVGNGTGVQGTGQYNDAFRLNKDASGWFKRDSATAPIIVWTTADSTVTINTDLIVEDTLTVGDSSYIYESADTLYIQSEKPIKVGDDCLIVAENGDVTCTKDLYAKFPYGYYSDTTDQADGGANAIPVKFNVTEDEYGMTMSDDTLVTFSIAGKYLITFSVIIKPGSAGKTFQIFPCKNDVPVTRSNTIWESIGTADRIVTVTYIIEFAATDTFHLCWYTNDASAILDYTAAASSPPRPQCPSIIMTINKISN